METPEKSEIAKLVWDKLKYTQCQVDGLVTSIIEIKEVWELIHEIESIIKEKQETIDLNIKTNMDLVRTIQRMNNKERQHIMDKYGVNEKDVDNYMNQFKE